MMKKAKKHHFKYTDPEIAQPPKVKDDKKIKPTGAKEKNPDLVPPYVLKDLKRTVLTIGAFVLILVVLFVIQSKTTLLQPVLRLFNL